MLENIMEKAEKDWRKKISRSGAFSFVSSVLNVSGIMIPITAIMKICRLLSDRCVGEQEDSSFWSF
jgi:selenocysteine lyase/cysteine desulfurase